MMNYLVIKALHIISVVTWFAGLFYMPRLFIYFAEAESKSELEKIVLQTQFKIMQRRLWYGITWPSAIAVLIFGSLLASQFWPISDYPWLMLKLLFVAGLYGYHIFLGNIFKAQQKNIISFSPMALRVINEVSTVFLVAIVFLVVLKNVMSMVAGIIGLILFIALLMVGIKTYKNIREKEEAVMSDNDTDSEKKNEGPEDSELEIENEQTSPFSEQEWKKKLSDDEFKILRMCGTEAPFTGKYNSFYEPGVYVCAACGQELFSSDTKYNSYSGWPSFFDVLSRGKVKLIEDESHGMIRVEVRCAACDSHLGHVFDDGPKPTGLRYCINSIAIRHRKSL